MRKACNNSEMSEKEDTNLVSEIIRKLELHEAHVPRANIKMTILLNAHVVE